MSTNPGNPTTATSPAATTTSFAQPAGPTVTGAPGFPRLRPRRRRVSAAVRRLMAETHLQRSELILPVFVREGIDAPIDIAAMPGQQQHTIDSLCRLVEEAVKAGIGGVNVFGIPEHLDATGSQADAPDGITQRALRALAPRFGDAIVLQADLCLDEYTDHGHCGVLTADGAVDNDATLERYVAIAQSQAEAGAQMVCPSGMMDGQVAAIRDGLDAAGFTDVLIMAYSAKYASAFFGPFREAVRSQLRGDRRAYQMDPANQREGLLEAKLDIEEGADVVLVKPAGSYLDVLAKVVEASPVPVWAYQVSGEYAMVEAAAANGWVDRQRIIDETLTGIKRAGAEAILTYWAIEVAQRLDRQ